MSIISTTKFIANHPLNRNRKMKAIFGFVKWQINSLLNPYPIIYQFTEKSKLIVGKGMTGATGNLYCGLHEYMDMSFLLHFLRKDDLFVDIGANIGSYTVLAAAHVEAKTISIEPVPSTFGHLTANININDIQKRIDAYNIALGSSDGTVSFTKNQDTTNHVATTDDKETIEVRVSILDNVLAGKDAPVLLKIDVEGFETEVLNGASETLNSIGLKAIIIELNGSGKRYGYDESVIHHKLIDLGFAPYQYAPLKRELIRVDTFGTHNTIYIRDIDFVNERIKNADKVNIRGNFI